VYPIMPICWVIVACGCFQCKVVGISNFALICWVIGTYFQWKVVGVRILPIYYVNWNLRVFPMEGS
jgi:hypothetical protein